jgi:hypothetical protein
MLLHHCATDGEGDDDGAPRGGAERERRKSETTAFCAGVKRPYQRMETGMSPLSTAPLWYVRRFGWGWTRNAADGGAMVTASAISSRRRAPCSAIGREGSRDGLESWKNLPSTSVALFGDGR